MKKVRTRHEYKLIIGLVGCLIIVGLFLGMALDISLFAGIRASFSFFFVLFSPGYVFVKLFLPDIKDWPELLAMSFGLSIVIVILAILFTNVLLKIPITSLTNVVVIFATILIMALLAQAKKNIGKSLFRRQ